MVERRHGKAEVTGSNPVRGSIEIITNYTYNEVNMTKDSPRKLYRSRSDNMLFGVCGGIAEYFGWDTTLVRLVTVVLTVLGAGSLILIYLLAAIIVPLEPKN